MCIVQLYLAATSLHYAPCYARVYRTRYTAIGHCALPCGKDSGIPLSAGPPGTGAATPMSCASGCKNFNRHCANGIGLSYCLLVLPSKEIHF
jgi:hypothetical protein